MGADGYGKDAMACVALAKQLDRSRLDVPERDRPEAYQERLDRIGEIFSSMMVTVDDLPTRRCPYKNRFDQCTAQFGCRNQRKPRDPTASCRSAAATTRSTTAVRGKPASRLRRPAARRRDADAVRRRGAARPPGADVVPADGPLPRVRRRGARRRRAPLRRRRESEAFLRAPYRLACQAVVRRPRRPRSRSPSCAAGCASSSPEAEPRSRPDRPRRAASSTASSTTARRRSSRRARGRLRRRRSTSARRPSCSSSSTCDDGRTVEVVALENPQRFGGSDVMNRISYDEGPMRRRAAAGAARARSTGSCASSTSAAAIDRREVYEVVIVGNATMRDLFFGLDVAADRPAAVQVDDRARAARGPPRDHGDLTAARPRARRARRTRKARVWGAPLSRATSAPTSPPISLAVGTRRDRLGVSHARRRRHEHRGRARRTGPDRRRELPGRACVRGRLGHLRHAGGRRARSNRWRSTITAASPTTRSTGRSRSGSAAPGVHAADRQQVVRGTGRTRARGARASRRPGSRLSMPPIRDAVPVKWRSMRSSALGRGASKICAPA